MTITFRITVFMILALAAFPLPINAMNPRNLEVTTPTTTNHVGSLKLEIKCGHCDYSPPPPKPSPPPLPPPPSPPPPVEHCPPPPPSPPPPVEYCPPPPPPVPTPEENCPPPPPPVPTPEENCPPPPPSPPKIPPSTPGLNSTPLLPGNDINIYGPPSQLYPIMETISAARRSFTVAPPLLVLFGSILLAFW